MNYLSFFPVLTEELIEACGYQSEKYSFSFKYQSQEYDLKQSGKSTIKLSAPPELAEILWKPEEDGLILKKKIKIEYPHLLFGKQGVAPNGAELGICIIWTNRLLTQTGCILPTYDESSPTGRMCLFEYFFKPGEIKGDLELSMVLFLKKPSDTVDADESHLINEAGVTLGEFESLILDFNSVYMEFPIEECKAADQPLWWVEFSQWEDPRVELFNKENICLYLNTAYDACPKVGENIKNIDMLIEIISTTYFLIFQRLSDDDLHATKYDIGLNPNSICSIMHQFILNCSSNLHWESPENLLKSIRTNVAAMLKEGEN